MKNQELNLNYLIKKRFCEEVLKCFYTVNDYNKEKLQKVRQTYKKYIPLEIQEQIFNDWIKENSFNMREVKF